ncbi:hypothetical protein UFOVP112_24 [uncultured Caudovirales phage]|uniref:Uncharacterized protein n=1 Tax=uncultured Caudovirales phage TaxID=2100421 RepID=A0A6J5L4W7_9CAUD|nr:hypothetical protein UFOVP112_24 [uncultured Caudovirales phage]
MSNTLTYCYLDYLPAVPGNLLENFEQYKENTHLINIPEYVSTTANGEETENASYERFPIQGKLLEWLQYNIVRHPIDFGASFNGVKDHTLDHGVHIDYSRCYSLIYLIAPGGNNVLTRFHQEEGKPIERFDIDAASIPPHTLTTHLRSCNLTLIDSVKIDAGRWVLLNTKVIHEVIHLQDTRVSIQISLGPDNKFITQG